MSTALLTEALDRTTQAVSPQVVIIDLQTLRDLVDGHTDDLTAANLLAAIKGVDGAGSGLDADLLDGQSSAYYLAASAYTAADVLAKLLTVDGAGSGVDADTLDTVHLSALAQLSAANVFTADQQVGAAAGGARQIIIAAAAGNGRRLVIRTGSADRWWLYANTASEGGANAGSNLALAAYADDGTTLIGLVWEVARSTRIMDFKVRPTLNGSQILSKDQFIDGSATWDPASVAGGGYTSTTVTATGAALGDFATAAFSLSLGNLWMLQPVVSATDTVKVVLYNPTGSAVDLGSGTLRVRVMKQAW